MSDLSPLPLALAAGDTLSRSAMPDAPVIPGRPRRRIPRLRLRIARPVKE